MRLFLKRMEHKHSIRNGRQVDDPVRTALIPHADFPNARPDSLKRLPVARIIAFLDFPKLEPSFGTCIGREVPELGEAITKEADRLHMQSVYRNRYRVARCK